MVKREFRVIHFENEQGNTWFKIEMVVTTEGIENDLPRTYNILDASSEEEFGRFVEIISNAKDIADGFKTTGNFGRRVVCGVGD